MDIYLFQREEKRWVFSQDNFLLSQAPQKIFYLRREYLWVGNGIYLLSFQSPAVLSPPLSCIGTIFSRAFKFCSQIFYLTLLCHRDLNLISSFSFHLKYTGSLSTTFAHGKTICSPNQEVSDQALFCRMTESFIKHYWMSPSFRW